MNTPTVVLRVATALTQYGLKHEVIACDPALSDTAAFCEQYGFGLDESANAIMVASRKAEPPIHALCVVLATTRLDINKAVCTHIRVKRASFAECKSSRKPGRLKTLL